MYNKYLNFNNFISYVNIKKYNFNKKENYMNKKQLKYFNLILNAWYNFLLNKLKEENLNIPKGNNYPDYIDNVIQDQEINIIIAIRKRINKLIIRIQQTINKIKSNNNFGYCIKCNNEIGIKRLIASPIANLCFECRYMNEIKKNLFNKNYKNNNL